MEISYYPGCTLKANAKNLETTTLPLLELFDIQAKELDEWYCCGVSFSQASDNLMQQLAPIRTLIRAKQSGNKKLLVPCDMCYNTLRRASNFILEDSEKKETIKEFMTLEDDLSDISLDSGRLVHAKFKFRIETEESERNVTFEITPPNVTDLTKKRHADIISDYLKENGVKLI